VPAAQIRFALDCLRDEPFVFRDHAIVVIPPAAGPRWREAGGAFGDHRPRAGPRKWFPEPSLRAHALLASAAELGRGAKVPVTWLAAADDSYLSPSLSRQFADTF
jgi:hypothetical protein